MLLLVTYRDDEITPGHPLRRCLAQLSTERSIRRVDVPRLTPAGVRTLAEGSGLAPDELHHLTSGNPFFLTEVLRDHGTRLPASAREAVLGRIDGLSRPARRTLDVAALLGARVDLALLDAVAAPAPDAVDELVDTGLLVADGPGLRFRHEITRRTVEDSLPPHRSAPLHGQILALLRARDSDDDARLAYHAEGASDAVAAQAHATLAARRAAALGAHREAAAQYERALRWAGSGDDRTRALLLDGLAGEYGVLDRWEDSLETRESALELWRAVGDQVREGDGLRQLSTAVLAAVPRSRVHAPARRRPWHSWSPTARPRSWPAPWPASRRRTRARATTRPPSGSPSARWRWPRSSGCPTWSVTC